jgi:molybdopterin/thiamine biosynthesis adenylyltransferase
MARDLTRYHRQSLLPGFGDEAQRRMLESTALVLGCGALGSLVADLLARAGVGRLVLVDRDYVELTNLQRQVLYDEQDVADAIPKAEAARRRLERVNSGIAIEAIVDDLNAGNIERHAAGVDVLVDGFDNFEARYLANDFAVKHAKPYVYGGAVGTVGAALAILPHTPAGDAPWESLPGGSRATPCFRCLFDEPPPAGTVPTCDTVGVLGPAVTAIASFEAAEAIKVLTGNFEAVSPTMLNIDLWQNTISQLEVGPAYEHADCICCRQRRFDYLDGRKGSGAEILCGRDAVQLRLGQGHSPNDLKAIANRLSLIGDVKASEFMLRADIVDNGKPYRLSLFPGGRAIIHGTGETDAARALYAKYIGI